MICYNDVTGNHTLILFWTILIVGLGCNREESARLDAPPIRIIGYNADATDIPFFTGGRIEVGFSIEIKDGMRNLVVIESLRLNNSEQLRFRGFNRYPPNGPISPQSGRGSKPLPMESLGFFQYSDVNLVPIVKDGEFSYQASWVFEDKNEKPVAVVSSIYEISVLDESVTVTVIESPLLED